MHRSIPVDHAQHDLDLIAGHAAGELSDPERLRAAAGAVEGARKEGALDAGMDIAAGEYGYDPWYFQRMLAAGAVDELT